MDPMWYGQAGIHGQNVSKVITNLWSRIMDIWSGTNRIKPKYLGLDSITSRVVVNGKLSDKSAIGRRGQYTAFLRFSKRFCGADFIENLVNGNIKVRDFRTAKSISDMLDPIRHYLAYETFKKSLLQFDFKDTVKNSFTGIYKYQKKNGPQSAAIIQFSS